MIENEKKELDLLLGNGVKIKSGDRELTVQRMNLGRILKISRIAIEMKVNDAELQSNDLSEVTKAQYNSVVDNAQKCAEIIATATNLNYKNDTEIGMLTAEILDEMTSSELLEASVSILKTADLANFMTSTFLMNGNRITQATKVEE